MWGIVKFHVLCLLYGAERPRHNGCHFPDDILKRIFLTENVWIQIEISLKFVPKGPITYIPALVYIMAWRRQGDKPLSEPMMVWLSTHICITRPQWVNTGTPYTVMVKLACISICYNTLCIYFFMLLSTWEICYSLFFLRPTKYPWGPAIWPPINLGRLLS